MLRTSSIVRAALALAIALPGLATVVRAQYEPSQMAAWAAWVEDIERGWADVAHPEFGVVSFGLDTAVLGPAEGTAFDVVSLGDGGSVTVGFDESIVDGPGDDLAVFENGFFEDTTGLMFAELAFVEVSTNGVDFARFPSRTWSTEAVGSEGTIDPVDYEGFGGLDPAGLGTGFDLSALAGHPLVQQGLLDLDDVVYVRLVDVIGDGSTSDALANPVYDPYPTAHAAGGMDADAVGALNVPEPAATTLLAFGIPGVLVLARRRRARSTRTVARGRAALRATLGAFVLLGLSGAAAHGYTVGFEDVGLGSESHYDGSDGAGGFASGPAFFENVYVAEWSYWYGFAASTRTDTTTPGFGNQYSAITGSGVGGSAAYAVFFDDAFDDPRVVLPASAVVDGFHVTNTTYAYLSMRDGDAFAKQFGGPTGTDPDWFTLTVSGYDAGGALVGSVDFDLADFRFADDSLDYILDDWSWVDLSSLGAVAELGFSLDSSDTAGGFLNTPTYFAMDGLVVVPEPGTALLVGSGLLALALRRRR